MSASATAPVLTAPPGWGEDPLSDFIEAARQNTFATFLRLRTEFGRLSDVDRLFVKASENLHGLSDETLLLPATFFHRAHSAYRGACRLASSGQVAETYPVLRACLEYSVYAFFVQGNRDKAEIWLKRSDDAASRKKVKDLFKITPMLASLADPAVTDLYERTIDFGAHPNELALTSTTRADTHDGSRRLEVASLVGDSPVLRVSLKTTAQVGVASLRTFKRVFRERFDLLGLSDALDEAARGL